MKAPDQSKLYSYLFHFNHITGVWNAFKREDYSAYFNGTIDPNKVTKNADVKVLEKYLSVH
jgi:hypothetical protein